MRVLVVGTGSVGRRHIGNLLSLGAAVSAYSHRHAADAAGGDELPAGVARLHRLDEALADGRFDAVVVANRNDQHMPVALAAGRAGSALFIEKPLSVSLEGAGELRELVHHRGLAVEAGFTLRCHPNLLWMRDFIAAGELGEPMHARAAVGQYLPDWRPGTDHRTGYAALRRTGGGVILDLVHELDLVRWMLGEVDEIAAFTRHVPALEIETEAIAQISLRLASGVLAQVHLDYVRPGYGRTFEIVGTRGVLAWDYPSATVTWHTGAQAVRPVHAAPALERNDLFISHMRHFLRMATEPALQPISSLDDSVAVMRAALACHRSAHERRFVRPEEIDETYRINDERE